jgi:stringent starvation protein B
MISKKPYLLRAHFDWIVDSQWTPYLLINAEYANVVVPTQYVRDGRIVLDISPMACRDLEITAQGVKFSARFSGQQWHINLPIGAVLAIYAKENSQGMKFHPEDEVFEPSAPKAQEPEVKKPFLTVISNDDKTT